jgi:hypothetical protein
MHAVAVELDFVQPVRPGAGVAEDLAGNSGVSWVHK